MHVLSEHQDKGPINNSRQRLTHDLAIADTKLVTRAQFGDRRAFDLLFLKYRDRIMKLTLRYTRNWEDAEDAAQIAFMRAYRGLKSFRGDSAFYSWLHRIAINAAATMVCLRRRDESSTLRLDNAAGAELSETCQALKECDSPEALALTEEMKGIILSGIRSLCEEQSAAIMMHEFEGLSYAEVASAMSCPLGTVRSRVFRAREFLGARLRQVYENGLGRKPAPHRQTFGTQRVK
jgi:RNA polymerase sigma-70 factor (ECF subfamily)